MTSQEPAQLHRAELLAIILRRQAMLLQQKALIEQFRARVADSSTSVNRLTQPPKDASMTPN